jgi:alcohol dehydrogenase (cytochrome c)
MKRILLSASVVAMLVGAGDGLAQQTMAPYTAQQAGQGRADYMANCAGCRQANLGGGGEAPSLATGNFMKTWGAKSTRDIYAYIKSAMPLGKGGSLSDATYANIVAFLLQANGGLNGWASRGGFGPAGQTGAGRFRRSVFNVAERGLMGDG